jgi:hypothetical protein
MVGTGVAVSGVTAAMIGAVNTGTGVKVGAGVGVFSGWPVTTSLNSQVKNMVKPRYRNRARNKITPPSIIFFIPVSSPAFCIAV